MRFFICPNKKEKGETIVKNSADEKNELRAAYLAYRAEWRRTHKESIRRSNQKYYQKRKKALQKGGSDNGNKV